MLKQMLLVGAALVFTPALAQNSPPAEQPAPAAPVANAAQVAQIVEAEFSTYDGDRSSDLNPSEFGAWMKKLRTATDPTVDPETDQMKQWIDQAFAVADGDKSGTVSKEELVAFLARGR